MCGICGIVYPGAAQWVERDTLAQINAQIVHRGPDDDGFFVEGNVGLAMRRLSIIDVRTGHQPISNEDGSLWIIFNGEIYNHLTLRAQMQAHGHQYRTNSDTESILHLYEEYGRNCVQHLRGMFTSPFGTHARTVCLPPVTVWVLSRFITTIPLSVFSSVQK